MAARARSAPPERSERLLEPARLHWEARSRAGLAQALAQVLPQDFKSYKRQNTQKDTMYVVQSFRDLCTVGDLVGVTVLLVG